MMGHTFFIGGTSAAGFQTKFQHIIDQPGYFTYILKGGPGTGKSTLMKKVAAHFRQHDVEQYLCSSDPRSLDAVVVTDLGIVVVDGTAPHVFNADLPGIAQCLVDLGTCWDTGKLKDREQEIRSRFQEHAMCHARAKRMVTALTTVLGEIHAQFAPAVNHTQMEKAAADCVSGFAPEKKGAGTCQYKQLAAITADGYQTQETAAYTVICIKDDRYAAGFSFMQALKTALLQWGHDLVVSECVLFPENQIEHILLPKAQLQFSLQTPLNRLPLPVDVDCEAFYQALPEASTPWLRAQALADQLVQEAAASIGTALAIHDQLEQHYIQALQFDRLNHLTKTLLQEMDNRTEMSRKAT